MFNGRLSRKNYLLGLITLWGLIFLVSLILWFFFALAGSFFDINLTIIFYFVIALLLAVFGFSLILRRHHDLNQSWIYPLLIIVSLLLAGLINISLVSPIGGLYSLYLFLGKGSEGNNNFGSLDQSKDILQIIGIKRNQKDTKIHESFKAKAHIENRPGNIIVFVRKPLNAIIVFTCIVILIYFGIKIYKELKMETFKEKQLSCLRLGSDFARRRCLLIINNK